MASDDRVTRNYADNFSTKEMMVETVIPKYFDDEDLSLRTIGMIGYTTEIVTNTSEDSFNAASVLFRESFANIAQLTESIYAHASIFQIDDIFASAASCKFLLVLEEKAILKNMEQKTQGSSIYNFFIDKNTTIYIEEMPFTLDYDIQINIVKKKNEQGEDYIFTAQYIMDEFTYGNSISELKDPYVKLRRSVDGYIALEVFTHQCTRDTRYETIISNSTINYPTITVDNFDGKLAGFDIFYKDPSGKYAKNGFIQMKKQIIYSQPISVPFCYYQLVDGNTLKITFNTKDLFFMPEFNSELEIILYITEGSAGNFDEYNGTDITLIPNTEKYTYSQTYLVAAKPVSSSENGRDSKTVDDLQALAVEGYRTANALTTSHDLQQYFLNYKHRYGDGNILFIEKRNDIYERVFSAFLVMAKDDYIYKTNSLNLKINLYDMKNPEKDVFMIDPGCLFIANGIDGYAEFFRDEEKNKEYYKQYLEAIENGEANFITDDTEVTDETPAYLKRPCSFAQYKSRNNISDNLYVFDLTETDYDRHDDPSNSKFLLMNPFLIRFTKSPNLVSTYLTMVSNTSVLDFTDRNSDSYVQFITYSMDINREFKKEKCYDISLNISPSISISGDIPLVYRDEESKQYILNDVYSLDKNEMRIFLIIKEGTKNICYTELYPTNIDDTSLTYKYAGKIYTDDHITAEGYLRILTGTIYRNYDTGEYYKVYDNDKTLYNKYDVNDKIIEKDVSVNIITELVNSGVLKKYQNVYNMTSKNDILIPLDSVTCEVYTVYKRSYDENENNLVINEENISNNILTQYDDSLLRYVWTNVYLTEQEPITFIKPLYSVRTYLTFEDPTASKEDDDHNITFEHDIFDVQMYSIGFLRASTVLDEDRMTYFMKSFFNNYKFLEDIMQNRLRNATNIDVKFYNTYGRSRNIVIGEEEEILNTVNLSLSFDMWFVEGTDVTVLMPEVKAFIKSEVERINNRGLNSLFISNLMRKIESNFAYVDHIRFKQINNYDSTYQAVKNYTTDIDSLSVLERRFYVPELLVCDEDDIHITEYYA